MGALTALYWARLLTVAEGSHTGFVSIPFEELVLGWLGGLIAPEGAHPDNPDGLSCGVISDALPEDGDFLALLGGEDEGIIPPDDPLPCDMAYLSQPALAPADQRALVNPGVLAFFGAWLDADPVARERWCHFVEEVLPADDRLSLD